MLYPFFLGGIFCCVTRRTDSVTDEIDKILGIDKTENESDRSILYVFNILWENGYYPNVDDIQEENIKQYLKDISQNGVVYEEIKAKKAVVYWKK